MNQEEINKYNHRCAEFLGFKYKNQAKFWAIYPLDNNSYLRQLGYVRMDELKFHSDWNWIMEIVKAIEKLGYFVMINKWTSVYTGKEKEGERVQITTIEGKNKKLNTVQAINQFLIWYNNEQRT